MMWLADTQFKGTERDHIPTTSSEKTEDSYFAMLSAVGAKTIQPQAGVRLAYRSRSRLSCE